MLRPSDNLDKLDTYATANLNAVFENPLAGLSRAALMEDVDEFCRKFDLMDHYRGDSVVPIIKTDDDFEECNGR